MHLAAMGGLWRSLAWGLAGISADAAALPSTRARFPPLGAPSRSAFSTAASR